MGSQTEKGAPSSCQAQEEVPTSPGDPSLLYPWPTSTYGEMVDLGESDKMIKISGKVDKSNTDNGFSNDISLLF